MANGVVAASAIKVLVVDDEADFRHSTARTLARHGYECVEAAAADQARLALDADGDIRLVLCDISMPDGSGLDLLTALTADFPHLAVVMTTGVDDPMVADVAFGLGAFGYVVKPFEANELLISMAGALRRMDLESSERRHAWALERTISRTKALGALVETMEDGVDASLHNDKEVMERLSRAVSLRDEETGRHIERMSRYAVVLANAVGFTGCSSDTLRLATAMHDVGKIGIPDGILLKPGKLSSDDRATMQRHAQIGHQLLADSSSGLLRAAADVAFTHHEWWDGGGYPRGLHGEEIPEEARIAAVADVFDALTSNRVYRPGLSFEEAIATMSDLRGRQFEPRLLDAFFAAMDEIRAIREVYPDEEDAPTRISVLVVDDHEIFTQSLVRLLGSRPEIRVVGAAGSVAEAVAAAAAYQPDVILMDFELPDGNGPQATEQIKARTPEVKVIMLTARTDEDALIRAMAAGCSGFVKKEEAVDTLIAAILAINDGEVITAPSELAPLMVGLRPTHRGLGVDLTARELDVLRLMASGLLNKQIAQRLGLQLNTVRNHVQNLSNKLQVHSKLEAVVTAVREGIIDYPSDTASG